MLWTALLLALGCRQEPALQPEGEQTGSLLLNFGSAAPTKAAADADGANFHNILVLIANDADKLIDKKFHDHGDNNYLQADTIYFWNLRVGEYRVYAYANIDHVDWQSAKTIQDVENSLNAVRVSGGDPVNPDRLLKELSGTDTPQAPAEGGMLLTGHKVLSVGSNENIGEIQLQRPVTRLNVFLYNHTQFDIRLDDVSFSSFNPSLSYLLGHASDQGVPQLPASNSYRNLPAFGDAQLLAAGSDAKVYSTLLYENAFAGDYRIFARITLDPGGKHERVRQLSDGIPVLLSSADVFAMQVGETKDVLLLNPNTNNGAFFGRNGSSGVKTDAKFSTEKQYADKAREIYADEAKRNQYVFVLRREADDAAGNRLYTLTIDGFNCFAANGGNKKPGAFIEEGALPSGSDPISADFEGSLLRFRTDAWGNLDYFRNSGNANPYYFDQKSTHDYEEKGIYQWAFYEVNRGGSPMRVIDNQTAQVSALRYMRRNQELNVVMNVYYEEWKRELDFQVDNAWWTDPHASFHVFK